MKPGSKSHDLVATEERTEERDVWDRIVHRFWRRRMDDPMAALLIFFGVGLIIGYWNPYFGGGFLIGGAAIPRSVYADGSVKVRSVPERGRADEVRAQTEAEPVGHTAKSALSLDRRGLDGHCPGCDCIHDECGYVVNSLGCEAAHDAGGSNGTS